MHASPKVADTETSKQLDANDEAEPEADSAPDVPTVSIIVPVYNAEDDLEECIDSLLAQTIGRTQIILVDDGSTDGSSAIAQSYADAFDNVEYYRTPNQGPGHARNFGMRYAKGEFVAFPDSDDVVDPPIYEEMVELARKHEADMVICDVDRFNTKSHWLSEHYLRALEGVAEVDHASHSTNLMFDTSPCNKIYRRAFYEESGTRFPEDMLYEDIATILPLQMKVGKIAFLKKVGYHWRVRDTASKSITQHERSDRNFLDRMKAIRIVDDYFDEHVEDRDLHLAKDYKLITHDFLLFLNAIEVAEPDLQHLIINTIADYLERVDDRVFAKALAVDRIKYHYVRNRDLAGLLHLRTYQNRGYPTLKIRKKGARWIGEYPFDGMTDDLCDMTEELRALGVRTLVKSARIGDDGIELTARVIMPRVDMKRVSLVANLIDEAGNVACSLQVDNVRAHKKRKVEVSKTFKKVLVKNQRRRFFRLRLPASALEGLPGGTYRIFVTVTNDGLECNPRPLSHPVREGCAHPLPAIMGSKLVSTDTDYRGGIQVHVKDAGTRIEEISIGEDGVFLLACSDGTVREFDPDADGDKLLVRDCYYSPVPHYFLRSSAAAPSGSATENSEVALNGEAETGEAEIGEAEIGEAEIGEAEIGEAEILGVEAREPAADSAPVKDSGAKEGSADQKGTGGRILPKESGLAEEEQLWRAVMQRDATVRISRMNPGGVCLRCQKKQRAILMDIMLPASLERTVDTLVFRGRFSRSEARFALDSQSDGVCKATVNFADKASVSTLRDDMYDLFVEGLAENGKHLRFPLYCAEDANEPAIRLQQDGYRYYLDRTSSKAVLLVHRMRKIYERTELERRMIQYVAYPLFRKLPLRKKEIVFEAFGNGSTYCSPGALYRHVRDNHPDYRCIWSLHDPRTPGGWGTRSVVPNTLPYFWHTARAKYLVSNSDLPDPYAKRPGQVIIFTHNGTPIKTVGIGAIEFHSEEERDLYPTHFEKWNWMAAQCAMFEEVAHDCFGYKGGFLCTGLPRTDRLIRENTAEEQAACKEQLGLPDSAKLVVYAPSVRNPGRFDLHLDLAALQDAFPDEYVFALRRHPAALPGFTNRKQLGPTVRDLTYEPDVNTVLLAADVLITDYSSIMCDFALTGRPMLFYAYDLDTYRDEYHDFNIDYENEVPGPIVRTTEEVAAALRDLDGTVAAYAKRYQQFKKDYLAYESDHSCEDVFQQAIVKQPEL